MGFLKRPETNSAGQAPAESASSSNSFGSDACGSLSRFNWTRMAISPLSGRSKKIIEPQAALIVKGAKWRRQQILLQNRFRRPALAREPDESEL